MKPGETPTDKGTRVPGRTRPAAEVLAEWRRNREEWKNEQDSPAMRDIIDLMYGTEEFQHRWKVLLDCGHHTEIVHYGDGPASSWRFGTEMLAGEYCCPEQDCRRRAGAPIRDVSEWGTRVGEDVSEPDPESCPYDSMDADTWARIRQAGPRTSSVWAVTLTCGHAAEILADPDWAPEDGFWCDVPANPAFAANLKKMIQDDDCDIRRAASEGFPNTEWWSPCYTCMFARKITAYQWIAPLVPKQPRPPDPRRALEKKIRALERELTSLRAELDKLPPPGS